MSRGPRIAIVGGGIAGLATAHALLRRGVAQVCLFEAQGELALHSSGRSAGIWLPCESIDEAPRWTRRSVELLGSLFGDESWIKRVGAYKVAPQISGLQSHFDAAVEAGCEARWVSAEELACALPFVPVGQRQAGIYVPEAGLLDTQAILKRLHQDSVARGLQLQLNTRVLALSEAQRKNGRWHLDAQGGSLGVFDWVIDASGAWGSRLFAELGYAPRIIPLRRHLFRGSAADTAFVDGPILWAEDPEYYIRPGASLWASPCDATEVEPGCTEVQASPQSLWHAVSSAPELPDALEVWSGTRNHTQDGCILKGPVPGAQGLAWLLGLAGRGMTVGLGVADAGAQAICEQVG